MRPTPTIVRLLAVALVLALTAPRAASAAADQPAILNLVLNHLDRGEVNVLLRDGDVLVSREDLGNAGLLGIEGRTERAFGKKAVSLASLAPALSFTVDEAALAIRIEAPARMLRTTVINASSARPAEIEQRNDPSAFLNYAVHMGNPLEVDGFLDSGLSFDGMLLQSSLMASSKGLLVRGLSSLTVDDQPNLRRWVLGESFVSGGSLGGGLVAAGLSVSTSYAVDPYSIHAPSLGYAGSTTTPAVVDVYVNGVLVKSQAIPPGPFHVQNLQAPTGSGDVRYVVRDGFGRQQEVGSPYYVAAGSLAKGLSEYTYSVGARRVEMATESFAYGAAGLLARHRYGVTDWLTAGVRFEGALGLVSGGPSLTLTLPLGQVDVEVAASAAQGGTGFAGLVSYTFASRKFSAGLFVRGASDGYSTLSLAPTDDRERVRLGAYTGAAVGAHLSIATQYAFALDRDFGASFRVGASATSQIGRRLSVSAGVGRSFLAQVGASFDAFVGLSLSFDGGLSASVGVRQDPGGSCQAYAEANKSLPAGNGVGYRAYAVAGESTSALLAAQYQGSYGRYQAALQSSAAGTSWSLDASGALVWVRGAGVLPTRAVQDGFAVIKIPEAAGVRGFLDNHEIGRTDRSGTLVLPTLLPYYANRISIADADLTLDRSVGAVERTIAPSYRGGALVLFESKQMHYYRGRLVVQVAGKTITPSYGELSILRPGGEVASPLGKQGEFELDDLDPGQYSAKIVHEGGECTFKFIIPKVDRTITDLGERRCVQDR